eukprot:8087966-Ditylum_brightwellii.AAC.1
MLINTQNLDNLQIFEQVIFELSQQLRGDGLDEQGKVDAYILALLRNPKDVDESERKDSNMEETKRRLLQQYLGIQNDISFKTNWTDKERSKGS